MAPRSVQPDTPQSGDGPRNAGFSGTGSVDRSQLDANGVLWPNGSGPDPQTAAQPQPDTAPDVSVDRLAMRFVSWLKADRACTIEGVWHRNIGTHYQACELPDILALWPLFGLQEITNYDSLGWNEGTISRVVAHAVRRSAPEMDKDPIRDISVINTSAGVFGLIEGDFLEYKPDDKVWTYALTWTNPTAEDLELLPQLIANWHPDEEERRYVWALLGGAAAGLLRKAFLEIWGPTDSGKSTLLLVLGCLGRQVTADLELKDIRKSSTSNHEGSLYDALKHNARFCLYPSETSSEEANRRLLKAWSGRDRMRTRGSGAAHGTEATYRPLGTMVLSTNDAPPRHEDGALKNRQRILHFGTVQDVDDTAMWHRIEAALDRPSFAIAVLMELSDQASKVKANRVPDLPQTMADSWQAGLIEAAQKRDPVLYHLHEAEGDWDGTKRTASEWAALWELDLDEYPANSIGRRMTARNWGSSRQADAGGTMRTVRWPVNRLARDGGLTLPI